MAISELSIEDKELMKDITEQLLKTTELKESLFDELSPLTEELSAIKKEEQDINIQYENISNVVDSGYSKEDAIKLKESSNRIYEIAKRKQQLELEIMKLKGRINPILDDEQDLLNEIHRLKNKSNDKIEIRDDGVIIDKIVVEENNISKFVQNIKINKNKNVIINTKKSISNFIKEKFDSAKNIEIHPVKSLSDTLSKFYSSHIKPKVDEFKEEFKAGYESVRDEAIKDRIDEILEQRQNLKMESENLEYAKNAPVEETKQEKEEKEVNDEVSNSNLLLENQDIKNAPVPVEDKSDMILDKDNIEVKEAIEIPSTIVEPKTEKTEEINNDNIFVSTPILEDQKNEVEKAIKEEKEPAKLSEIDHFVKLSSDKIAKTTKSKVEIMINIFNGLSNNIGKVVGNVKNNIDTKKVVNEKKKEIYDLYQEQKKNLKEMQKNQMKELNNQYVDSIDNMENIFVTTSMSR